MFRFERHPSFQILKDLEKFLDAISLETLEQFPDLLTGRRMFDEFSL